MKANQYLIDFYTNYDEDSRLEPKHGTVEFLTTMRYIQKYFRCTRDYLFLYFFAAI